MKEDEIFKFHCKSLALFMIYSWNRSNKTYALFVTMVESFDITVEVSNSNKQRLSKHKNKRRIKAAKNDDINTRQNEDVELVDKENTEETLWRKKNWQTSGHILRRRVKTAFQHCMIDVEAIVTQHAILKAMSEEMNKVKFISHATYHSWTKEKRKSSTPIEENSCEVMDRFASLVEKNGIDELETVLPPKKEG